ncbi:NAD(P)-binding domain-containing protein [Mesorhizobium sp. M0983]|uniref:NAD(P)-binding domain-containing protein n=1 Tax=Mesorhizobium sp. M0983 TaxID=2957040 RepID=UPI0033397A23
MQHTDVAIIGAGQAGLAMSRCLSERGVYHVVLERGRIAERWRSERWDSLRLLTPNWMTRLPGCGYRGANPDGFMTMAETVGFLKDYACSITAPVANGVEVLSAERVDGGFRLLTDRGQWGVRAVVVATGYSDRPRIPTMAKQISSRIRQIVPRDYRNPQQLPQGWRSRGRGLGDRHTTCGGDQSLRTPGDPVGWQSYTPTEALPRARHPVVARPAGNACQACR